MCNLVVAALALVLLAGCGGSGSEGDEAARPGARTAETEPGNDEFVRRVDAACKSANPALLATSAALVRARDAARAGRASAPETFERFATLLRRAVAITDRLKARVRAIDVPRREQAFRAALMDSIESGSRNLGEQVRAAEAQDARRLSDLSRQGSLINARGKGLITGHGGFRHCGRGGN